MLWHQVNRIQQSQYIDKLIIATSNKREDQAIADLAKSLHVSCYRGDLENVLGRFYQAALEYLPQSNSGGHTVVRLTADCPLTDPELIDKVISFHHSFDYDYTSNALRPTYPDGLDVEVMQFSCLREAWINAQSAHDREHVTPYIYRHKDQFTLGSYTCDIDHSDMRWTVDEEKDFQFVTQVYQSLYCHNPLFTSKDIFTLLEQQPELSKINQGISRNEGQAPPLCYENRTTGSRAR